MSNLPLSDFGRGVLLGAMRGLTGRRLGKRIRRNFFLTVLKNIGLYDDHASLRSLAGDMNVAHDIEMTNVYALSARWGQNRTSMTNEIYYVDPVNGDDEDGNGKADHPFASLWFLNHCLPDTINHHYRVLISGTLTCDRIDINANFGPNGSLSVIGVGAPTQVKPPEAVTTKTTQLGGTRWQYATIYSDDSRVSQWIRFTSGAATNYALPVFINRSNALVSIAQWPATAVPIVGDQFDLITPTPTINCNAITVNQTGVSSLESTAETSGARVGFYNLSISMRGSPYAEILDLSGPVNFSFVRLLTQNDTPPARITNARFNTLASIDDQVGPLSNTDLINLADIPAGSNVSLCGLNVVDGQSFHNDRKINIKSSDVASISCRYEVQLEGACRVSRSNFSLWRIENSHSILTSVGAGSENVGRAGIEFRNSSISIASISAFNLANNATGTLLRSNLGANKISINSCDQPLGMGVNFGYILNVRTLCSCTLNQGAMALNGSVNDILWSTLVVPAGVGYPLVGAGVTDAIGSWVTGLT